MPKQAIPLTILEIKTRPAGLWADGRGLYLHVNRRNARSWIFRYKLDGLRHDMGLGSIEDVSLALAREKITELRLQVRDGIDPIKADRERAAKRRAERNQVTFNACVKAYIAANRSGWKSPKNEADWASTMKLYAFPTIGDMPVREVDTPAVLSAIGPIWNTKTATASRLRGRIETVLDYAKAGKLREGENPARWKGHLDKMLPKPSRVSPTEHHEAMHYRDVPAFMLDLKARDTIAGRALRFAILTCARTNEVTGARWAEFDVDRLIWTIPANRMKAGKEHRVALSTDAAGIITAMAAIRTCNLVFPGKSGIEPMSNMTMLAMLKRMRRGDLTVHGFRSSFRDWAAEETDYAAEVAELALAHNVGTEVERAYRRSDQFEKRRRLAEAWARWCDQRSADVVPIRA